MPQKPELFPPRCKMLTQSQADLDVSGRNSLYTVLRLGPPSSCNSRSSPSKESKFVTPSQRIPAALRYLPDQAWRCIVGSCIVTPLKRRLTHSRFNYLIGEVKVRF